MEALVRGSAMQRSERKTTLLQSVKLPRGEWLRDIERRTIENKAMGQ